MMSGLTVSMQSSVLSFPRYTSRDEQVMLSQSECAPPSCSAFNSSFFTVWLTRFGSFAAPQANGVPRLILAVLSDDSILADCSSVQASRPGSPTLIFENVFAIAL